MPNLIDSDLRDPSPPVPGQAQRAAVATRAQQLGRKRRMMQGVGALGMVAAVAVGVAAFAAGGTSGSGTSRIEAAGSDGATDPTDVVVATTAPAPNGTESAGAEAPAAEAPAPAAVASTFTVSGTVGNIPAGVTLTLSLSGSDGTFSAIADADGDYSIREVPADDYEAMYEWVDPTGTATQVAKLGTVTISGDSNYSFSL